MMVVRSYNSRRRAFGGDFGDTGGSCKPGLYWSQKTANSGFVTK